MKRSRFTEEQILLALKQMAAGQPVPDVCRQIGIEVIKMYQAFYVASDLWPVRLRCSGEC